MAKALLLFSGGLDSILATEILRRQKIKITPVCFKSYFFECQTAKESAKNLKLKLKTVDFSNEHLKIVKSPKYGYGKGTNPCLDCHLLMVKKAKEIMEKEKYDFLATGEVLGERPFSQNIRALMLIEKEAGLVGLVLRPLSAKLLPETIPEKKGMVKMKKLFAFQGKSRKPQLLLAKKFKIKKFPTPAGGCILTDLEYAKKIKELFLKNPNFDGKDSQILRKGRALWHKDFLIIVGRNEKENKELKRLKKNSDFVLEPRNFPGPAVIVRSFGGQIKKDTLETAKTLILKYSKKNKKQPEFLVNEII